MDLPSRCWSGLQSSKDLTGAEGSTLKLTPVFVGRGLHSSAHGPLHGATWHLLEGGKEVEREVVVVVRKQRTHKREAAVSFIT